MYGKRKYIAVMTIMKEVCGNCSIRLKHNYFFPTDERENIPFKMLRKFLLNLSAQ